MYHFYFGTPSTCISALTPAAQRLLGDAQVSGQLGDALAAHPRELHRLGPEGGRVGRVRPCHREPLSANHRPQYPGVHGTNATPRRIYATLGIRKEEIAKRQAWQNLLEAQFGTQARMADYAFARAGTWDELLRVHEQWVADYNEQMHWAHRQREDGRHSPQAVLDNVRGRHSDEGQLHRVFYTLRFGRVLDGAGYARLRHWKVYGERGLARQPVGVWLYSAQLLVEYREEPLAEYRVTYEPGKRRLKMVTVHRLFETPFRARQPWLFPLDDAQWRKAWRVPSYAPRSPRRASARQLPLFAADLLGALLA